MLIAKPSISNDDTFDRIDLELIDLRAQLHAMQNKLGAVLAGYYTKEQINNMMEMHDASRKV